MRKETRTAPVHTYDIYVAEDGTEHYTEGACLAHEAHLDVARRINLKAVDIPIPTTHYEIVEQCTLNTAEEFKYFWNNKRPYGVMLSDFEGKPVNYFRLVYDYSDDYYDEWRTTEEVLSLFDEEIDDHKETIKKIERARNKFLDHCAFDHPKE